MEITIKDTSKKLKKNECDFLEIDSEDEITDIDEVNENQELINELSKYLKIKSSLTQKSNPLEFYQTNQDSLPIMSKMISFFFVRRLLQCHLNVFFPLAEL